MIETDAAGNIKPTKQHSTGRIDGLISLIIAMGLAAQSPQRAGSVYETRGVLRF